MSIASGTVFFYVATSGRFTKTAVVFDRKKDGTPRALYFNRASRETAGQTCKDGSVKRRLTELRPSDNTERLAGKHDLADVAVIDATSMLGQTPQYRLSRTTNAYYGKLTRDDAERLLDFMDREMRGFTRPQIINGNCTRLDLQPRRFFQVLGL